MATGRPYPYKKYSRNGKISRRERSLTRFLVLLAAICALVILVRGRIFVIREIEVTGNSVRSASEIAGLSGLSLGMNIFNVDELSVERNFSANNYVELVKVHIELPDTVILEVRERTPCAAVNCAGVILLVDQEGFILERRSSMPQTEEIIVVSGMDVGISAQGRTIESGTAGQMEIMRKLLAAIETAQAERLISEMNIADPDNLYLVSQSGIQVLLGDEDNMESKLMWMQAVLEKLTQDGVMRGVLDVSSGKNATYADR